VSAAKKRELFQRATLQKDPHVVSSGQSDYAPFPNGNRPVGRLPEDASPEPVLELVILAYRED
jgi:hypothetical protein